MGRGGERMKIWKNEEREIERYVKILDEEWVRKNFLGGVGKAQYGCFWGGEIRKVRREWEGKKSFPRNKMTGEKVREIIQKLFFFSSGYSYFGTQLPDVSLCHL